MSDIAMRVENLSKLYHIGHAQQRHDTLRDALVGVLRGLTRRNNGQEPKDAIWALKDISFEVKRGEAVGIIGRNGAGKSTLLKILSRITEPTSGRAVVNGRIGSLLEVGTGFHPELTGRENIFLNGAILGMKRTEIARRFDEIVAFAEVEQFLDTPVKHYSSGMYVRLAFAVAAHLEPEILLVDEVLAVGDAAFQKKCLGKMGDVAQEGRTVLFVSHNMSAVQRLCLQTICLDRGQVRDFGSTDAVTLAYLAAGKQTGEPRTWIDISASPRLKSSDLRVMRVWYSGADVTSGYQLCSDGPVRFVLEVESERETSLGSLSITVYDRGGTMLVNADSRSIGERIKVRQGVTAVCFSIQQLHLKPGTYNVGVYAAGVLGETLDHAESALDIAVIRPEMPGYGAQPPFDGAVTCDFSLVDPRLVIEES